MKRSWWKLIVVVALVAAVAAAVALRSSAPEAGSRVAESSGVAAPADDRKDEAPPKPTENTPPEPVAPTEAAKPDSGSVPKDQTQAAASAKGPVSKPQTEAAKPASPEKPKPTPQPVAKPEQAKKQLPKLIDLGATKCIPCKMMAPILEDLRKEYKGRLEIVFIDVWENRGEAEKYGIRAIPTQIFYDEDGKEFHRHEGFFAKEDILKTFRDNGIEL